ncbi:hypothetical protein LXL04_011623 [Taraxacum kok-saghyz]
MAAIASMNLNAEDYVDACYSKKSFLKCYAYTIHPLNDSSMWPTSNYHLPLPPKKRRLPGRPTIKRKRNRSEREISGRGSCPSQRRTAGHQQEPAQQETAQEAAQQEPAQQEAAQEEPIQQEAAQEEPIPQEAAPRGVQVRRRKMSARITKQALRRKVVPKDGSGCSSNKPVDLN